MTVDQWIGALAAAGGKDKGFRILIAHHGWVHGEPELISKADELLKISKATNNGYAGSNPILVDLGEVVAVQAL